MDQQTLEYALLAGRSYQNSRDPNNRFFGPTGWKQLEPKETLGHSSNPQSGFEAVAFRKGDEIVISYAGTDFKDGLDLLADGILGLGFINQQLTDAALFYKRVQAANPTATITFTGHSLGGGLAAVMGVFFNHKAITFDPAPFRLLATKDNALKVAAELKSNGFGNDIQLDLYTTTEQKVALAIPAIATGLSFILGAAMLSYVMTKNYPTTISRESNVIGIALEGELLTGLISNTAAEKNALASLKILGSPLTIIPNSGVGSIPSREMHSLALLIAIGNESRLGPLAETLPGLYATLIDGSLYGADTKSDKTNFLERLVREEYGIGAPATGSGFIKKFADDLSKLVGDAGIVQTQLKKELTIVAMEYYGKKKASEATGIFNVANGGLHFNYSDINATSYKSLPRLAAAIDGLLGTAEKPLGSSLIRKNAWHIQQGSDALVWIADAGNPQDDAAIGGIGVDILDGGAGADILIGGAGADVLTGGAGYDTLLGGLGYDSYLFNTGSASDSIADADGEGTIKIDGQEITGGKKTAAGYWISDDKKYDFTAVANGRGGTDLIIGKGSSLDRITIHNWQEGQLGIKLLDQQATQAVVANTYTGDRIVGSGGNDQINGLGGNEALSGSDGDDSIDGGAGDDVLMGGMGRDTLTGGLGNDYLFGSGNGYQGLTDPTLKADGTEWSRGTNWVAFAVGEATGGTRPYQIKGVDTGTLDGDEGNIIDGGAGNDLIRAGSGSDMVHGGSDSDNIMGLGGNDALSGDDGDDKIWGDGSQTASPVEYVALDQHGMDIIDGGAGNDYLEGQGLDDMLYGGAGKDVLWGDSHDLIDTPLSVHGNDYLDGGGDADTLIGGGKDDELFGGEGDDRMWGDGDGDVPIAAAYQGNDYLDGEGGNDTLVGGGKDDHLFGGSGKDELWGDTSAGPMISAEQGKDYLDGEDDDDFLAGGGNDDELWGGAGNDEMWGDASRPGLDAGANGKDYLDGEAGNDTLVGGGSDDQLYGSDGNDQLRGDADVSVVAGTAHGNDFLDGGTGSDTIVGDGGNDILYGGDGNDELQGDFTGLDGQFHGADMLDGGIGNDRLFGGGGVDTIMGGDGDDSVNGDDDALAGQFHGNDQLSGGNGNDLMLGGGGNDVLSGGAGNDELQGDSNSVEGKYHGNDMLDGGEGNDALFGGGGNDTLMGGVGDDYLNGDDDALPLSFHGNDYLDGGEGNDNLVGGGGNDTLVGGTGNDSLSGGLGSDTYVYTRGGVDRLYEFSGNADDIDRVVMEDGIEPSEVVVRRVANAAGDPNDLVMYVGSSGSVVIPGFFASQDNRDLIELVQFADGTTWDVAAIRAMADPITADNDTVRGHIWNDSIDSLDGNDTVYGYAGNDGLAGSAGDDKLFGGDGDDVLLGGDGNDYLEGGRGNDTLDGGAGDDDLVELSYGDAGSPGATRNDLYLFGRGYGSDKILEYGLANGGSDTIRLNAGVAPSDVSLYRNGSDLVLTINGTPDQLSVVSFYNTAGDYKVEQVVFHDGTVWDLNAIDARTISGAVNAMTGTAGDDTFVVDNTLDTVAEAANQGIDTIQASVNYALSANVENLTQTGVVNLNGGGNELGNIIHGNGGNNRLGGNAGTDTLYGGAGNDYLDGGTDADLLYGDAGNDTLIGGTGNDTLAGGTGDDWYMDFGGPNTSHDDDVILEAPDEGIDTVMSEFAATLPDNVENLIITGNYSYYDTSDNVARGNALDNVITVKGQYTYTLDGGEGADTLIGGTGDTIYVVDNVGDKVSENNTFGYDVVRSSVSFALGANLEDLMLVGTDAINGTGNASMNTLTGNYAGNVLDGGANSDRLIGGRGNDTLIGGTGYDTFVFQIGDGQDQIDNTASDNASAVDTIELGSGITTANIILNRVGDDLIVKTSANDSVTVKNYFSDRDDKKIDQLKFFNNTIWDQSAIASHTIVIQQPTAGPDTLTGTLANDVMHGLAGNDTVFGGAGDDQLFGDDGDDELNGEAGNDTLDGGVGADTLSGGAGNDAYIVDAVNDVVIENLDEGVDSVNASVSYTLAAHIENLNLLGSEAVNGTGNALNNTITGNSADNTLNGGDGTDTLVGGAGNDTYIVDSTSDSITENPGEGIDTVISSVDYYFFTQPNLENITLVGTEDISASGNAASNVISGNGGSNFLDGDAGADTLAGGAGDDYYVVDDAGDIVIEQADEGIDRIYATVTYTLGANIENLVLRPGGLNGTGNALNNVIAGNSSANLLSGGDGSDIYVIDSGGGQDKIDNTATDNATAIDILQLGSGILAANVTLTRTGDDLLVKLGANDNVTVLNYFATATDQKINHIKFADDTIWNQIEIASRSTPQPTAGADTLTGTSGNDTIDGLAGNDTISGGAGDDQLFGGAGDDTLNGDAGNDTLNGGAGTDTMKGGVGNDTYIVDNTVDMVTENANEGVDSVQTSVTYTLGANVENLTLTGTGAINGTGNTQANVLTGNSAINTLTGGAGNDTLDGGAGADKLIGGTGNDLYIVDNTGDILTENASEGTDTVQSSVTFTLGANLENLTLTGATAINGAGNSGSNILIGNSANNTLDGGSGADTLSGGLGDDTYVVDNIGDAIIENAGEGTDRVQSSLSYTLGANLENLSLTGASAINGTGNALDNVLTGNSAANMLTGGAGNDTLNGAAGADKMLGGAGNDTYVVDNASDVVTENANEGIDLVQSSITQTLAANVEALFLTGTSAINGTGNALNNLLQGNSAANTLNGAGGNDILQAAAGNDKLTDTAGNNLLDGGAGTDTLAGGAGREFFIGGAGSDTITTGTGADIIAFNRGDGMDVVNASTGTDNTLSLGKGIKYADLLFKKNSNDLILVTGTNEQVTFKDWYLNTNNHSVANLQIVIEGTTDYNASSTNQLNNKKIEQFNFNGLVDAFDQARAANSSLTSWALSSSLLNFYLASSDTAAIGGDLAYQYAKNGNLSALSMTPADALLSSSSFGTAAQNLQAVTALQDLSPRLM